MTWTQTAACRNDPRFTPGAPRNPVLRRICAGCPVRWECLYEELCVHDAVNVYGVRGGFGPAARKQAMAKAGGDVRVAFTDLFFKEVACRG